MKSYRIHIISLLLVCVFLLCACSGEASTPSGSSVPENTGERVPDLFTAAGRGLNEYSIVRPDKADSSLIQLSARFCQRVNQLFDSALTIKTDFVPFNETINPEAPEILVGDTNREESIRLRETLDAAGGYRFAVLTTDRRAAVLGTDVYATYLGLDYLLNTFTVEEDGGKVLKPEKNLLYVSEEQEEWSMDFSSSKKSGQGMAFYIGERLAKVPTTAVYNCMQGGTTDGKYAYYAMLGAVSTIIYKYDLSSWKMVASSGPLEIGHANDLTFDSKRNLLAVARCDPSDGYLGVCFVDPDTLTLSSYTKSSVPYRAMEYLPNSDRYLLEMNFSFILTDGDFRKLTQFSGWNNDNYGQGICCDKENIYHIHYVPASNIHYITIHTLSGVFRGQWPLYGTDNEPENLFLIGAGEFALGCNGPNEIYRVKVWPEKWWGK